jgi:peptide-methionine (S)-S-oxide reductase
MSTSDSKAYFSAGCSWCVEAIFKRIRGVKKTIVGYSGGRMKDPTYEQVASGITGHAETVKIVFDKKKISYEELLYVFFRAHDPTTVNRQGFDVGTQYRSAIFYVGNSQKMKASKAKKEAQKEYEAPIVTQIKEFCEFYEAEDYHQDYYNNNPGKIYCKLVIDPKIARLEKDFIEYLKKD